LATTGSDAYSEVLVLELAALETLEELFTEDGLVAAAVVLPPPPEPPPPPPPQAPSNTVMAKSRLIEGTMPCI
jgi:hypothetical protein